jgi:hypothetical protein
MPSPSDIKAGEAFVEIHTDNKRLEKGLKEASKKLKAWGQSVTAAGQRLFTAGLAAAGGLFAAAKVFSSMGDTVQKMSQRTGISAEVLSELGFAAEQSGTDLATVEMGIRRMQAVIGDATNGLGSAEDALANLGLTVSQLVGLSPDQQFEMIADGIAKIEDPSLRAAAAMDIFGRSGTMLLPLMSQGAAGIRELRQQARDLGLTISTEDADSAARLGDALNMLWRVVKQGVFLIGSALAPVLTEFAERAAYMLKSIGDWIKENRALVVTIFQIALGVLAAGAALIMLGNLIAAIGTAIGVLTPMITAAVAVFKMIPVALGALLSPVGLVIGALAALGAYFLYVSGLGQKALEWLREKFNSLRETVVKAWKGIGDALAAGDLALAAEILWLTLKLEWQKGIAWLTEKWNAFKETFQAVGTEAVYGLAKLLTEGWAAIQRTWVEVVAFMQRVWSTFIYYLVTAWRTAQNWIAKKFVQLMAAIDPKVDAEAAMKILDEDFAREQKAREHNYQEELNQIEDTQKKKQDAIEKEREGAIKILEEEREKAHVEHKKQNDEALKAAQDAVEETRKKWQEALDRAAQERAEFEKDNAPEPIKGIGELKQFEFEGLAKQAISVVGTFNPLAAAGLSAGSPLERAARAGEETAKNTKKLVQQAQHGGLVFA